MMLFSLGAFTIGVSALSFFVGLTGVTVQSFNPVLVSAAVQKQCIGERIRLELLLSKRSQIVYYVAKVCVTAGDIHRSAPVQSISMTLESVAPFPQ